jgi:hypothetical protein
MLLNKGRGPKFTQPSRWTFPSNQDLLKKSPLEMHAPMKKSFHKRFFFNIIGTYFPIHILKFTVSAYPLSNTKSILGLMLCLFTKSSGQCILINPWLSMLKSIGYPLPISYTPLHIHHGYLTPSPLIKNGEPFKYILTSETSTNLLPRTIFQPLPWIK